MDREVANENPLILRRTLFIVGALVLLERCVGKKCELRFYACLNLYIIFKIYEYLEALLDCV